MKILQITPHLGLGGTERAVQNYSLGLKERGYEVAVMSINGAGPRYETLKNAGVKVAAMQTDEKECRAMLNSTWDVVHIHRGGAFFQLEKDILEGIRERQNCPIIETSVFSRRDYVISPNVITLHLHLSEWCLYKWARWGVGRTRTQLGAVLPYAVEPDHFRRVSVQVMRDFRAAVGIPMDALVIGRVGSPADSKWDPSIIEVFARLPPQINGHPVYALFVGAAPSVKAHAQHLDSTMKGRMIFREPSPDDLYLSTVYSTIDVFLHMAHIGESFGMVIAESLLCETPVVTLSTPLRDNSQVVLVRHNECGLVANDHRELLASTQRLLTEPETRSRMGVVGRQSMVSKYSLARVSEDLEKIYAVAREHTADPASLAQRIEAMNILTSRQVTRFFDVGRYGVIMSPVKSALFKVTHSGNLYRLFHKLKAKRNQWRRS